jgi:hypothetical protein
MKMKLILYLLLLTACTSCFKTNVIYECKKNCVPLLISGKITNATTGNLSGVSNKLLEINYHRKNSSKPCLIGAVVTDISGNYSLTANIDTADLGANIGHIEIEPQASIVNNYFYSSNQPFKIFNYNNGNYVCDIVLEELVELSIQLKRTLSDSFHHALLFPTAFFLKDVAGTSVNIKFADSTKNRNYKYKTIANALVKIKLTKHSGIFDANNMELNNIVLTDSLVCLPGVENKSIIEY